jgi:hypothetical protein
VDGVIDTNRIADVFVEVADTLVGEFDVMEFLQSLAVHASELTGAAATAPVRRSSKKISPAPRSDGPLSPPGPWRRASAVFMRSPCVCETTSSGP